MLKKCCCSQRNVQIRHETLLKLKKIIILSFRFGPSNFFRMFSSKRHFRFFSSQLRVSVRSPSTFSGKWEGYWSNESGSDAVGIVLEENSSDFWKGSDFLHLDFLGVFESSQQTNNKQTANSFGARNLFCASAFETYFETRTVFLLLHFFVK